MTRFKLVIYDGPSSPGMAESCASAGSEAPRAVRFGIEGSKEHVGGTRLYVLVLTTQQTGHDHLFNGRVIKPSRLIGGGRVPGCEGRLRTMPKDKLTIAFEGKYVGGVFSTEGPRTGWLMVCDELPPLEKITKAGFSMAS